MDRQLSLILPYILLAAVAGVLGGLVALFWKPRVKARSAIQHFAAGAVLAAVASNVVPEVERSGTIPGIIAGFAFGGLVMIGLKWLVVRFEKKHEEDRMPIGLALAAGVDTFLDGAIISAGFSSGQRLGTLLTAALSVELFFLTLSVGAEFRKGHQKPWQGVAVTSFIAALLLVGALASTWLLSGVSEATLAIVLAFGAAALIYLIAEELLVENVQAEDSLIPTAMLFAGFLVLVVLKLVTPENGA